MMFIIRSAVINSRKQVYLYNKVGSHKTTHKQKTNKQKIASRKTTPQKHNI